MSGAGDNHEQNDWQLFPPLPEELDDIAPPVLEGAEGDLYSVLLESQCGATDDSQPVEQYDGTLGVTTGFVAEHQVAVGQLQWNDNLATIFTNPGNVSGVRWCTGTLIGDNMFLTAGHCFDQNAGGWSLPRVNGTSDTIPPPQIATNMHVNFNYQVDPSGNLRAEQEFPVMELTEYRLGGLDYAIVRLGGNPRQVFGRGTVSTVDPPEGDMACIIGHPAGQPKRIEAGPVTDLSGNQIRYNDIDTLGGNSGSGVLHFPFGLIGGVHTNGGCTTFGTGFNFGMRISSILAVSPLLREIAPPDMVVANFAYHAGGWRVERHPRFMADITGDGRADIVGFGDAGVWVSRNNGDGTFQSPQFVVANFGYTGGGWRVERHPRFMADLTGNGRADIVGFGDAGVWASINNGDGTFQAPEMLVANFAYNAGGWRVEFHPRFLADLTGDGRADIVGFGDAGVWVSLNNGDGTFQPPQLVVANFAYSAGGWRVERHPRFLADLTGDGRADIVGFGDGGVWVSLNNGNGTFQPPQMVVANFAYNAGGWRVEQHPRFLADVTGDGRADIVGFGDAGVWVSRNNGNGTFQPPQMVVNNFAYNAGGWRVERHPRFMADVTGDGRADIVGFGDGGVWVSLNNGDGTFQQPRMIVSNFAYSAGSWRVEQHPRFMADISGDGQADIVGFGDAGVWAMVIP